MGPVLELALVSTVWVLRISLGLSDLVASALPSEQSHLPGPGDHFSPADFQCSVIAHSVSNIPIALVLLCGEAGECWVLLVSHLDPHELLCLYSPSTSLPGKDAETWVWLCLLLSELWGRSEHMASSFLSLAPVGCLQMDDSS